MVRARSGIEHKLSVGGDPVAVDQSKWGDILVNALVGDRQTIFWYGPDGRPNGPLVDDLRSAAPVFLADGNHWFVTRKASGQDIGIYKCSLRPGGCTRTNFPSMEQGGPGLDRLAPSPDDKHLAYIVVSERGPYVNVLNMETMAIQEMSVSETACPPLWSSTTGLWISTRIAGEPTWIEYDVRNRRPTGRRHRGIRGCLTGYDDPGAPIPPRARIEPGFHSQIWLANPPGMARH